MNKYPLICLSGADLSGKQTQTEILVQEMKDASLFSFPDYSTISGQLVRACLTDSELELTRVLYGDNPTNSVLEYESTFGKFTKVPKFFQVLQYQCRYEKQPELVKALKKGPVICDRYKCDALVYGTVDGCNLEWIRELNSDLLQEDLTIILLGPQFKRNEVADANEKDGSFRKKIIARYEELAVSEGWKVVYTVLPENASKNVAEWTPEQVEESKQKTHRKIKEVIQTAYPELDWKPAS